MSNRKRRALQVEAIKAACENGQISKADCERIVAGLEAKPKTKISQRNQLKLAKARYAYQMKAITFADLQRLTEAIVGGTAEERTKQLLAMQRVWIDETTAFAETLTSWRARGKAGKTLKANEAPDTESPV